MIVGITNTGKRFIVDRAVHVVYFQGLNYYKTASGNIVRQNADGTWTEITKAQAEANILLMPYEIAVALFPANPVFNETI